MITAVIIDDEQHCINRLQELISRHHSSTIQITGKGKSFEEGKELIASLQPQLVFLDVQLQDKTGFDLLKSLPVINFEIVFTTAYEKFAIQAIKFSAIDYLLKPIDSDDLAIAVTKLNNEITQKATAAKLEILLQNIQSKNNLPKKITVPTSSGFEFLDISDIVRCESNVNYTTIHSQNKQKLVVAKTLKEFEELLSDHTFFRVHNSHLINLTYIKSYQKGKGGSVILSDGEEIEVSTRRKEEFLKKLAHL